MFIVFTIVDPGASQVETGAGYFSRTQPFVEHDPSCQEQEHPQSYGKQDPGHGTIFFIESRFANELFGTVHNFARRT